MRKNLGKFLLLLIFFHTSTVASSFKWSSNISRVDAVVNEAIYIEYRCEFKDRGELYTIEFEPKSNEFYDIKLLKRDDSYESKNRVSSYRYVMFAKKVLDKNVSFKVVMKETSQESIDEMTGSRDDDVDTEQLIEEHFLSPNISLHVEETKAQLVGDFTLGVSSDKVNIDAYEPFHLELKISGVGNFNDIKEFNFSIEGVEIFKDKPYIEVVLSEDGYRGIWTQKFAFVGSKNFIIPKIELKTIKPKATNITYLRNIALHVEVKPQYNPEELLDKPEPKYEFNYDFIYYILIFIAGYLTSKIDIKLPSKTRDESEVVKKVRDSNSLDEICIILAMSDVVKYRELIEIIESKKMTSKSDIIKSINSI